MNKPQQAEPEYSQSLRTLGQERLAELIHKHEIKLDENTSLAQVKTQIETVFAMSDFVYRSAVRYKTVFLSLLAVIGKINLESKSTIDSSTQFDIEQIWQWPLSQNAWLDSPEKDALKTIRVHRHQVMSTIATLHFLKVWDIKQVMHCLSELAARYYGLVRDWAVAQLKPRYGQATDESGELVPLIALGMGKLGGYELNFSSDIDLIFCYPIKGVTTGGRKEEDFQSYFTRVAQKIIYLLDSATADGQVYRVDMRLRPFGDSGPLVSSYDALEDYYQEQGRDWERYALLKARPLACAGFTSTKERDFHADLEDLLRPFVYRRYIDFSVIESLRKMKQQIRLEVKRRQLTQNIKLGEGGIREAEFIIQAMQMLRGGKEPQLQLPSFLAVLPELVHLCVFTESEGQDIKAAYLFLRDTEQLLQAFDDKQTQTLPGAETSSTAKLDQQRLLAFFNFQEWSGFEQKVQAICKVIHQVFNDVIGDDPDNGQNIEDEVVNFWQGSWQNKDLELSDIDTSLVARLNIAKQMHVLKNDLLKSVISSKGRDKLDTLMPLLLAESERQNTNAKQTNDLLMIIKKIASRTTYLSLLIENPGALTQLVKLVSCCDFIGQQLKSFPLLLDQLIDPKLLYTKPNLEEYATDLRRNLLRVAPDDLELQMEILRQFKLSSQLIVAACDVEGVIDLATESNLLTALAEAILAEVVNLAWRQMIERYGYPDGATDENKNFAVIGYGKLGGFELGYGSDLDIVFVHGCNSTAQTDGKKAIDSRQFYLKLAQRILHIFTTRTPSGVLYEIDTRLRPSGASGLMAINIDTFFEYQQTEAWTWEHQALVRARMVLGDKPLIEKFEHIRDTIITHPRDEQSLIKEISDMRQKMFDNLAKEKNDTFDLKQSRGGIADIEFITQYLVLRYSHVHYELKAFSDNKRLLKAAAKHSLLTDEEADNLWAAYEAYRDLVHDASLNLQPTQVDRKIVFEHAAKVVGIWQRLQLT